VFSWDWYWWGSSGNDRIAFGPGDDHLKAQVGGASPIGFTGIHEAVAVWVFQVVWNSVAVGVVRISAGVEGKAVKADVEG
jgi:hypothetical protein